MTKVKICGITNLEDALLSVKFGADALGFNFYPKSPRFVEAEKVRKIVEKLPREVLKVGVFVNESLEIIAKIAEIAKLDAIQLHGEETPEFCREVKEKTNLEIIKAFRVSPTFTPDVVLKYEVDAILLDAYNPNEHGGTGETFDWKVAFKVKQIVQKLYLAGGLDSKNVDFAIRRVQPFAVDSCSLLEKEKGKKDKFKTIHFIVAVNDFYKKPIKTIYDLLLLLESRAAMFIGRVTITNLYTFLYGIKFGLDSFAKENSSFDWKQFAPKGDPHYEFGFQAWISTKFKNNKGYRQTWSDIILFQVNDDEEKAFDLFFALLEEFKLEKENSSDL